MVRWSITYELMCSVQYTVDWFLHQTANQLACFLSLIIRSLWISLIRKQHVYINALDRERERERTWSRLAQQSRKGNSQISHKWISRRLRLFIQFFPVAGIIKCKSYIILAVAHPLEQKCVAVHVLPSSTYSNLFSGRLVVCLMRLNWR